MRIYRIETELGTLHARRVDAQPYQHPSEVVRRETYEQCTTDGAVINGNDKLITGSTEADIIAAGGILVPA